MHFREIASKGWSFVDVLDICGFETCRHPWYKSVERSPDSNALGRASYRPRVTKDFLQCSHRVEKDYSGRLSNRLDNLTQSNEKSCRMLGSGEVKRNLHSPYEFVKVSIEGRLVGRSGTIRQFTYFGG